MSAFSLKQCFCHLFGSQFSAERGSLFISPVHTLRKYKHFSYPHFPLCLTRLSVLLLIMSAK